MYISIYLYIYKSCPSLITTFNLFQCFISMVMATVVGRALGPAPPAQWGRCRQTGLWLAPPLLNLLVIVLVSFLYTCLSFVLLWRC